MKPSLVSARYSSKPGLISLTYDNWNTGMSSQGKETDNPNTANATRPILFHLLADSIGTFCDQGDPPRSFRRLICSLDIDGKGVLTKPVRRWFTLRRFAQEPIAELSFDCRNLLAAFAA